MHSRATRRAEKRSVPPFHGSYPTNPPRVDYELTERGKKLIVPLRLLWTWAQANRTAIEGARRDFDQQRGKDGAAASSGVTRGCPGSEDFAHRQDRAESSVRRASTCVPDVL